MEDKKKILGQIISAVEIEALMREGKNEEAHSNLSKLLEPDGPAASAVDWVVEQMSLQS